jgi:hypothetical protein
MSSASLSSSHRHSLLVAAGCVLLVGCDYLGSGDSAATLYRSTMTDAQMRIHVATFDAKESASYNWENCQVARGLFQGQSGVTVKYWCEKGRCKK